MTRDRRDRRDRAARAAARGGPRPAPAPPPLRVDPVQAVSEEDLRRLELAVIVARDHLEEYNGDETPLYDNRRIGRMLANETPIGELGPRVLAELRARRAQAGTVSQDVRPSHAAVRTILTAVLERVGMHPCSSNACYFGPPGGTPAAGGCTCHARRGFARPFDGRLPSESGDFRRLGGAIWILAARVAALTGWGGAPIEQPLTDAELDGLRCATAGDGCACTGCRAAAEIRARRAASTPPVAAARGITEVQVIALIKLVEHAELMLGESFEPPLTDQASTDLREATAAVRELLGGMVVGSAS